MKRPFALLFALLLATAGCNAFGGLSEEGMGNDPQRLFQDATIALQSGEPAQAVRYLRRIIGIEPDNVPARLKLGTALMAEADISALDLVRLARTMSDELEKSNAVPPTATPLAASPAASCSFPAGQPREVFDPADIDSYDAFRNSRRVLAEVRSIDERVLGEAASFEKALSALHAEVSETEAAAHLLNAAVAQAALAYLNVAEAGGDAFVFYYVTPPRGDRYVGYCAPDRPMLDEVLAEVACHLGDLNAARRYVRARATLLGSGLAQDLADEMDEAYAVLANHLDASCSASSGT